MTKSKALSGLLILLAGLFSSQAFSGWVESNTPLQSTRIIPHLCDQIVLGNNTGINIESRTCQLNGLFTVTELYQAEFRQKIITTLLKLEIKIGSLRCRAKLRRNFSHDHVNTFGEIIHKRAGWEVVYVDDCRGDINPTLLGARVGHENVRRMTPVTFTALPLEIKRALLAVDVSYELGEEGDYQTIKKSFYRVFDTEYKSKRESILGYLGYFQLKSSAGNIIYVTVRFNQNAERVGKLDREP
ncbi:MAG: hypothetical protein HN509_15480 [Halobacteriovoraceae bacterium]|jgi:hypothetical protein|nr:hypothetical protein [Halobacteriovoraceae bacterium]MBT5092975.1 hypothetical protein [Halobacteriovoraceae bacterium]